MKTILFTIIFLTHTLHPFAQTVTNNKDDCDCKPPSNSDIKLICNSISLQDRVTGKDLKYFSFGYEVRLMEMAGANVDKDGIDIATEKLQCFWNKYKTMFICNFNLSTGSVLKLAIAESFTTFVLNIAGTYGLDICFIDKSDGLSLCGYLQKKYKEAVVEQGANHSRVKTLANYLELFEGVVDESCNCTPLAQ